MVVVRSVLLFIGTLILVSLLFPIQVWPWYLWLFGIIFVVLFFYGSEQCTKRFERVSQRTYVKRSLSLAFIIRLVFVLFIYKYNWAHFDTYWGVGSTDVTFYVPEAMEAANRIANGDWTVFSDWLDWHIDFSDTGYMYYLTWIYVLTGRVSDVIIPLILKAIMGTITCLCIYKITARHFGEGVGRIAGILAVFYPSFIWWCGSMMKETEMLFITITFAELVDSALMEEKIPIGKLIFALIWGAILFSFRTILGVVAYLALLMAIILSSSRIVGWGKKLLFGVIIAVFVGVAMSDNLKSSISSISTQARDGQSVVARNNARAKTNSFAKYATATVMAPLIFTVPFPSLVYTNFEQEQSMQRSGANYVKNILSFFVVLVMFVLLLSGEWRRHVFLIAIMMGYLIVLVFSSFAHAGRFHLPAELFEVIFAAYGISLLGNPKYKRLFTYALWAEFIFIVGWNYLKLAGRGLA